MVTALWAYRTSPARIGCHASQKESPGTATKQVALTRREWLVVERGKKENEKSSVKILVPKKENGNTSVKTLV